MRFSFSAATYTGNAEPVNAVDVDPIVYGVKVQLQGSELILWLGGTDFDDSCLEAKEMLYDMIECIDECSELHDKIQPPVLKVLP